MKDENNNQDTISRLKAAELQLERSKVVMDTLAGFCHALGQPATVLLSSVELMRLKTTTPEMRDQILDICYDAVLEIRTILTQMKAKREYVSEAYLKSDQTAGNMLSLENIETKESPKANWD